MNGYALELRCQRSEIPIRRRRFLAVFGAWRVDMHAVFRRGVSCRREWRMLSALRSVKFRIPQAEMTSCGLHDDPLLSGIYPAAVCWNLTNGI